MTTNSTTWRLRRATPDDEPFLKVLFRATENVLQCVPPALQEQLATMQYSGREMTYAQQFPDAVNWILCSHEGALVGRHLVESRCGVVRSIDLAVLPAWQGRGIGTAALQTAMAEGLPVHLRVVKGNRALRLYERLGFHVVAEDQLALELVWTPGPLTSQ